MENLDINGFEIKSIDKNGEFYIDISHNLKHARLDRKAAILLRDFLNRNLHETDKEITSVVIGIIKSNMSFFAERIAEACLNELEFVEIEAYIGSIYIKTIEGDINIKHNFKCNTIYVGNFYKDF